MSDVRTLTPRDVERVVERVERVLADDAARNPLVAPTFDRGLLARALGDAAAAVWVAHDGRRVRGHLYGAVLDEPGAGRGAWVGPDGVSADDVDTLAALYAVAGQAWIDSGAREHYVWVLDDPARRDAWCELGFARAHQRGVRALDDLSVAALPEGYVIRRASIDDLESALSLSAEIDRAQARGPSFALGLDTSADREDLAETLTDPDVGYHLVEVAGEPVAQCLTFALPARRGSFPATVHLSAVAVREAHRGRGVATALVSHALDEARRDGFTHAETNWRVTNRDAARYWRGVGFRATYVRLHRTIGAR